MILGTDLFSLNPSFHICKKKKKKRIVKTNYSICKALRREREKHAICVS